MRVTFIHNPKSGAAERLTGDELVVLMRDAGHKVVSRSSKEKNWDEVLGEPADVVAVAGGDGTVGKVVRRLVGRPTPVAVLPTGTANNIATALGLADAPLGQLIAGWERASRVRFDVGVARGPWGTTPFVEGFGVGLFARTMSRLEVEDSPERARLEGGNDKITTVREMLAERLRRSPALELTVTLDGRDLSGSYVLMEAMNISHIGPNLHLAPGADPGDGVLDVVLLAHGERGELADYLTLHPDDRAGPPSLTVRKGKHLQLRWGGYEVHIDDEAWPGGDATPTSAPAGIEVTAGRHACEFLVPE